MLGDGARRFDHLGDWSIELHVDSRRSCFFAISAYNRPGTVHRFANTTDVVAAIEDILGLGRLSKFDYFSQASFRNGTSPKQQPSVKTLPVARAVLPPAGFSGVRPMVN
ncbi:MAG TPA: hypothetical protein VEK84_15730 [Terriglobales bacterium]|nr:hypothetical protein [Terriglobales bacterium]